MKVFVLNCGSSSIKSQILETSTDAVLATALRANITETLFVP